MRRHDVHISNDVTSVLGLIFAGGPLPAFALFGLITLGCLGLQVLAHPGPSFAGAVVIVLSIASWRVGSGRDYRGRMSRGRMAATVALLLGVVLAYQMQWGYLGRKIDEVRTDSCKSDGFFGSSSDTTSRFLSCRHLLTRDQVRNHCARLLSMQETRTFRLILTCD